MIVSPNRIRQVQDSSTLPERVADQLRSMVLKGDLRPGAQLPTEPELSRAMNVSRSTLRSALDRLTREGVIVRKRGVGTFVAEQPLVANNLNLNWGVTDVIRSTGAVPGITDLRISLEAASYRVAGRLNLAPETPIVQVERVRLADGRRVVFSRDLFAHAVMKTAEGELPLSELERFLLERQSLYAFLKDRLALEFHHAVAWLRPMMAERDVSQKLQVPAGSAILYLEQVDYAPGDIPLVLADEYYAAEAFTFTVYRSSLGPG